MSLAQYYPSLGRQPTAIRAIPAAPGISGIKGRVGKSFSMDGMGTIIGGKIVNYSRRNPYRGAVDRVARQAKVPWLQRSRLRAVAKRVYPDQAIRADVKTGKRTKKTPAPLYVRKKKIPPPIVRVYTRKKKISPTLATVPGLTRLKKRF